jgi:hypothetical protein
MATANETPPIPIVDFGAFLKGSKAEKEDVARQLDDAFRNVGFVYLKNHGVAKELVDECFEWVCNVYYPIHTPSSLYPMHTLSRVRKCLVKVRLS